MYPPRFHYGGEPGRRDRHRLRLEYDGYDDIQRRAPLRHVEFVPVVIVIPSANRTEYATTDMMRVRLGFRGSTYALCPP